ncbi:uncharacterized protein N7511_003519 [Penicillium nucicola]|uniref:uncharacterized protein n=1 Tax=Penicillium nucicola TaxID=1850975 RepID=UPI0025457629|nr:uncharacterized protein N7511_003519 [Penicillium nucicola]KAJ5771468.1 hypothetical protein N7511_003519 [Penicillium nucicola]
MPCGHHDSLNNVEAASSMDYAATHFSLNFIRTFAGASSGIASSIVTCPLDVIKMKLQAQGGLRRETASSLLPRANHGLLSIGRQVWREKGLRGMYQGLGPSVLAYFPRWAIFFTTYHRSHETFDEWFGVGSQWMTSFMSSLVAGTFCIVATNPILVIKTRLMSQTSVSNGIYARPEWQYKSAFDAARQIYSKEGVLAFYSGLTPALLGVSHLTIQFPLYEKMKRTFTGSGLGEENEESHYNTSGTLMAASFSKIVASSATYPHEVIRTRLHMQQSLKSTKPSPPWHSSVLMTASTIWQQEGWRGFYAGMKTSMIRAVPASVTTMFVYENVLNLLTTLKLNSERKLEKASL